jgi:hypothetical protein
MTHPRRPTSNGIQRFAQNETRPAQQPGAAVFRILETGTHASAAQGIALLSVARQMTIAADEKGAVAGSQDLSSVQVASVGTVIRPALAMPKHGERTEDADSVPESGTIVTGGEQMVAVKVEPLLDATFISHDRALTTTSIASSPLIEDNRPAVTPENLSPGSPANRQYSRLFQGSISYDQAGEPGFADVGHSRAPHKVLACRSQVPTLFQ